MADGYRTSQEAKRSMSCLRVCVIGGFLGSGETTLLIRLLAYELDRESTPAVLMNEFGEMDIDGTLLYDYERSADIECDLSDGLTNMVCDVLKAGREGPIFVVTTGPANVG